MTTITALRQPESRRGSGARSGGLPVDIQMLDCRALTGSCDRIYSIGMLEHVGARNYRHYFTKVRELLKPDGLFLLHTIGGNRSTNRTDLWIEKFIFPISMLPSIAQIAAQYGERFRRMWRYCLSSSAAAFRARSNQLWQVLMSPNGIAGGVREVRQRGNGLHN